jgi:integral membrane sensor domain MASE1
MLPLDTLVLLPAYNVTLEFSTVGSVLGRPSPPLPLPPLFLPLLFFSSFFSSFLGSSLVSSVATLDYSSIVVSTNPAYSFKSPINNNKASLLSL